jgi:hypothetical protein
MCLINLSKWTKYFMFANQVRIHLTCLISKQITVKNNIQFNNGILQIAKTL